jgi:hypothetical protein
MHNKRDDYFKSSFKRRKRDSDSDDIYNFLSSFLSIRLFSIIISRRRVNNVKDTHVMSNSIVSFFSYILVLRKKVTTTKTRTTKTRATKTKATKTIRWSHEKAILRIRITTINTSTWDLFRDSSLISLRSQDVFEDENSRLRSFIIRYSIINIDHFKSILKEDFKSINMIKLCTDYEKILTRFKYIKMSNILKIKTYENNIKKFDVKKISHLMRYFLIYI